MDKVGLWPVDPKYVAAEAQLQHLRATNPTQKVVMTYNRRSKKYHYDFQPLADFPPEPAFLSEEQESILNPQNPKAADFDTACELSAAYGPYGIAGPVNSGRKSPTRADSLLHVARIHDRTKWC